MAGIAAEGDLGQLELSHGFEKGVSGRLAELDRENRILGRFDMRRVDGSLHEVAELLIQLIVPRLSIEYRKGLKRPTHAKGHSSAVEHLTAWLGNNFPEDLLTDPRVDTFGLIHHCCELLKGYSSKDLAIVLGLADSGIRVPVPAQTCLYLPSHIEVPSDAVYHQLRDAIATGSFFPADGTVFPTAPIETKCANGYAQLKPLELDTVGRVSLEYEAELGRVMFKQLDELSDLDSDVWDYCNWRWLRDAKSPEQSVTITLDELLAMRGILKKLNGQGQRGGYKRCQKTEVLKSIVHLRNVLINLYDFELRGRGFRSGRSAGEPIRDRAIRLEDGGQADFDGEILDVTSFGFRPGNIFARYVFGPGRQTALLSAKALEYDPRTQQFEKRLIRFLSWIWRVRASKLSYFQPFRVSTLLEKIHLPVNGRFPTRTLDRLERALETIATDRSITQWQYENGQPDQSKRGWVNIWLQETILIEPPQAIFDQYQNMGTKGNRADVFDIGDFGGLAEQLKGKRPPCQYS